jgi:hypothetical protein
MVEVVAFEVVSLTPLHSFLFMSLPSATSQLSMNMLSSLIFFLLKLISPWRKGMIFSSRILAARLLMLGAFSLTHPLYSFESLQVC